MLSLFKSKTRADVELLGAALFKFFVIQSLMSSLHLFKALTEEEGALVHPKLAIVLAIIALVSVVCGAIGVKTKKDGLVVIAFFYLGAHTLLGIADDGLSLLHNFQLPKSLFTIVTIVIGAFMGFFQTYCVGLILTAGKKQRETVNKRN